MTPTVITVSPETTFKETAELLLDYGVSGMPVLDGQGRLVGLVTEADLMSKEAFDNRHRRSLAVVVDLVSGNARYAGKAGVVHVVSTVTYELADGA